MLGLVGALGAAAAFPGPVSGLVPTDIEPVAGCSLDDAAAQRADAIVASLTPTDLAAQLMMVSVYGAGAERVDPARVAANRRVFGVGTPGGVIRSFRPGGVLLLAGAGPGGATDRLAADNVQSAAQVRALVAALRSAAGPTGLSVAADQEGGRVARLASAIGPFASAADTARAGLPAARSSADRMGRAMAALGVDVDFAPDADVVAVGSPANGVIGDRSFGSDPALVADAVGVTVDALQARGVAAVAKHFPGHGESVVDTHRARALVTAGLGALERRALVPFRAAVARGVVGVMVGHLDVPALDPLLPASLSPRAIGYLREELGFCGVVYSDGLTMTAVRSGRTDREVARLAYLAGVDVLVGPPDPRAARAAIVTEASRSADALARLRGRAAHVIAWRLRMDDRRVGAVVPTSTTSTIAALPTTITMTPTIPVPPTSSVSTSTTPVTRVGT